MWTKKVSCLLAVLALCGTMAAGAADYTVLEKADKVETTIYGTTQTGSLNDRIASVDKLLNGKSTVSGSLQDKANSLYKDVYGNSGSALRRALLGNTKYISQRVIIPANTLVTMTNLDELNSKTIQEGDVVRFTVADDVLVGDVIAIPRGMEVNGTVTKARKSGRFGKDGKIEIMYDNVRAADGSPVALMVGDKTKDQYKRTAGAVGASAAGAVILGPVGLVGGLFVHGNEVDIPAGTTMYAETKANTEVVGFKENGVMDDMETADMAASGVTVPSFNPVSDSDVDDSAADEHDSDSSGGDLQAGLKAGTVTPVDLENTNHDDEAETVVKIQSNTAGDANE